jgi:hypothetical protein
MEGRVGVVVTGELEEIVVMTDGLMTRTPKKLCDLLDVEDWLALYHVRSPALSLGVAYALLIYPGGSTRLQPTLTWKRSYLTILLQPNMTLGVGSNSDSFSNSIRIGLLPELVTKDYIKLYLYILSERSSYAWSFFPFPG